MKEEFNNIKFTAPDFNAGGAAPAGRRGVMPANAQGGFASGVQGPFRPGVNPQGMQTGFNGARQFAGTAGFTPQETTRKKNHTIRNLIIIIALSLAGLMLLGIFLALIVSSSGVAGAGNSQYVGVLYIEGEISSSSDTSNTYQQSWLLSQIDSMILDDNNQGLLLYVNSPGGSVSPSDEMYLKVMEYKETTERPVYAYFADTAASGAYYISAGADCIYANRNCVTGSIGVFIGPILDISGLLDKLGINAYIIKSADNKAMGNGYEPFTEEQQAIYQAYIDEYYQRFVEIVADGRGMDIETVKQLADGRIYTATQAKGNGLIDEIGSLDDAENAMTEALAVESCDFVTLRYEPKTTIYSILGEVKAGGRLPASELELAMSVINGEMSPEVMYKMQ